MKTVQPPKFPIKILRFFCSKQRIEELEGDLYEEFQDLLAVHSPRKARFLYLWTILRSLRPHILGARDPHFMTPNIITMLRHYLKTAFRGMRKNMAFTTINVVGLSVGVTCTLLISLFITDQFLMDDFLIDRENIVRLEAKNSKTVANDFRAMLHPGYAPLFAENTPEILAYCSISKIPVIVHTEKEQKKEVFEETFIMADTSFFTLFPFEIKLGNRKTAMNNPSNVIITERIAQKYFGSENPIGKQLKASFNMRSVSVVSAVIKDIPKNSSLQFDFLVPRKDFYPLGSGAYGLFTSYFLLNPETDRTKVLKSFVPMVKEATDSPYLRNEAYQFTSFADVRYNVESADQVIEVVDKRTIIMFGLVAILILLLATINYINLTASQALQRAQEAGIRKIIGAGRGSFIYQFLTESLLICLISLPISLLLLRISKPYFELALGKTIFFNYQQSISFYLIVLVSIIALGLLAGIYPAILVSRFKFSEFIKGKILTSARGTLMRKGMVVIQFVISIALILGSIMVQRQLQFMQKKTLGYEPEQVLVIEVSRSDKLKAFKESLAQIPEVIKTSLTSSPPGGSNSAVQSRDLKFDELLIGHNIDEDYLDLLSLELVKGENFDPQTPESNENSVLINETMAKLITSKNPLDVENPLDESYSFRFSGSSVRIRGVIKDFHMESLHKKISPMIFSYKTFKGRATGRVLVKVKTENIPETVNKIEEQWRNFIPEFPFRAEFMNSRFQNLYSAERREGKIFKLFTFIAIFISSLGLFGLISFLTKTKMKEISVRKILGASATQIVVVLTRQVYSLIFIATVISIPIAYLFIRQWLNEFAYRSNISLVVILTTVSLAFIISGLTMSYKVMRTVTSNPVDSLRNE